MLLPWGGSHPIGQYKIFVSEDEVTWTQVQAGTFTDTSSPSTVYFNKDGDTWMYTYDASFIKLVAEGQDTISLKELDILGPTGDNVELTTDAIGKLTEDFVYSGSDGSHVIPKGSVVFHGKYKGDPSYNIVLLKDQNGHVISGDQVIFAEVPKDGKGALGETSDGTWLYWVAPTVAITEEITYTQEEILGNVTSVQAELYRVQDALTLEGERLTSTSLHSYNFDLDTLPNTSINSLQTAEIAQETQAENISAISLENLDALDKTEAASTISFNSPVMMALANNAESTQDVVTLTSESDGIHFTVNTAGVLAKDKTIGTQVSMKIDEFNEHADPAENITVEGWENNSVSNEYRASHYDKTTGDLVLYAVARTGQTLPATINGTIKAGEGITKFTASSPKVMLLNSGYGKDEKTSAANQAWDLKVERVDLDKDVLELKVGTTKTLTATVKPDAAKDKSVTWAIDNPDVATVTVNEDGTVTVTAKKAGTATITVTTTDGSKTAICKVTVVSAETPTVSVTGVTLDNETLALKVGGTGKLTPTVSPANATNPAVTWSSSDDSIVSVGPDGTLTAKKAGTVIITVTTVDGRYTATCTVTVTEDSIPSIPSRPSRPSRPSNPSAPPTIPVIGGDDSESVPVEVKDNIASVGSISDTALQALLDNANGEPVEFDFSGLGDAINEVELPKNVVEAIADSSNDASGITILTAGPIVSFDAEALNHVVAEAKGNSVQLHVEETSVDTLSQAQKDAVASLNPVDAVDIYLISDGTRITDFGKGNVYVRIPFEVPEGFKPNGFFAWYISDDGSTLNRRPTSYDSEQGLLSFRVHHFSNYVISYMEPNDVLNCQQDTTCPLDAFTDLETEEWYHDGIHYVLSKQLMIGMADKVFAPGTAVSRAMVAQILYANAGRPDISGNTSFSDVDPNAWYAKAVAWIAQNGSVAGYTDGTFRPDRAVTREELAAMLYGAEKKPTITGDLEKYPDKADVSDWAYPAVLWATQNGIITGNVSGSMIILDPRANATRAQLAAMIMQYIE